MNRSADWWAGFREALRRNAYWLHGARYVDLEGRRTPLDEAIEATIAQQAAEAVDPARPADDPPAWVGFRVNHTDDPAVAS